MLQYVYSFAVLFVLAVPLFADCPPPHYTDPDDFFDNIGRIHPCPPNKKSRSEKNHVRADINDFSNGMLYSSHGGVVGGARGVVIADGGVIYLAGRSDGGAANNDFIIMKYFADGSLDTSFDNDGKLSHSFGNTDDWAHGIALQTNGTILVAGRSDHGVAGAFDFAVLRITSTGLLDTTFNTTGKKTIAITSSTDIARAIVVQTDGLILLAGYGFNSDYDNAYCRLTTDGRLDTTFNTTGKLTVANGASDDGALAVAIDSNGMIIGAGNSFAANWEFGIVRMLSSGELDTSFNTTGKLTYSARGATQETAYGVAIDRENRILPTGVGVNGVGTGFGVTRRTTSGLADTSFNTTGKTIGFFGVTGDYSNAIAIETTGTAIIVAGSSVQGIQSDIAVARFRSDGILDTSFATTGTFMADFITENEVMQAIAMKGDGTIIVAGREDGPGPPNYQFAMVRLQSNGSLAKSGMPALSFGTDGYIAYDINGTDTPHDITSDSKGSLVQSGITNGTDFAVMRYTMNGRLDTSFYTTGKNTADFGGGDTGYGITIQTDGRIVQCGQGNNAQAIVRWLTDGKIDTTFNTTGKKSLTVSMCVSISVQTDAKLVMTSDTGADHYLARMESDGTLDTSFATIGRFNVSVGAADNAAYGKLDSTGRLYVLGSIPLSAATTWVRVLTSGSLDNTFSGDGKHSFVSSPGGDTILIGGSSIDISSEYKLLTAVYDLNDTALTTQRLTDQGVFDTTFRTTGMYSDTTAAQLPGALKIMPNDKTTIFVHDAANTVYMDRILSDGNYDNTFNSSGKSPGVVVSGGANFAKGMTVLNNGWLCGSVQAGGDFGVACFWQ